MKEKTQSYKELQAKLDDVLEALQNPDVDIEEAITLYKNGVTLLADLEKYLESAKNEISTIKLT
jgi:exodeoxyribonuclease VII small subunit